MLSSKEPISVPIRTISIVLRRMRLRWLMTLFSLLPDLVMDDSLLIF
jgi:hypothetical protein